jgi:hypothetical protein
MSFSAARVGAVSDGVALGFISMLYIRGTDDLTATHARLTTRVEAEGLRLEKLYVQSVRPSTTAFDLLGALLESHGASLVVPSLHHLWILGHPVRIRDHLHHSSHNVLTAH